MLEIIITMTINVGCRREGYQLLGLNREEFAINTSPAPAQYSRRKVLNEMLILVLGNQPVNPFCGGKLFSL